MPNVLLRKKFESCPFGIDGSYWSMEDAIKGTKGHKTLIKPYKTNGGTLKPVGRNLVSGRGNRQL